MEVTYEVFKTDTLRGGWHPKNSFQTYEEAVEYLKTSDEVRSGRYWKIEKVWGWPF